MLFLLLILISNLAYANPIKIAVIDTGFDKKFKNQVSLCSSHMDTTNESVIYKSHPPDESHESRHGTNISVLIANQLIGMEKEYCLMIVKYYNGNDGQSGSNLFVAFKEMTKIKPDIVNFSGGGTSYSALEEIEVKNMLDLGIQLITAAGNESQDISTTTRNRYYPASLDPRIVVVGALNSDGKTKLRVSNWGNIVDRWEIGDKLEAGGTTLTGTSQSTAIATGKIVREIIENRRKNETKSVKRRN